MCLKLIKMNNGYMADFGNTKMFIDKDMVFDRLESLGYKPDEVEEAIVNLLNTNNKTAHFGVNGLFMFCSPRE